MRLILSGDMHQYDDVIGFVRQIHPEKGFLGILSGTVSETETRIVYPDNLAFVGTLPNQKAFHAVMMANGGEFGFYITDETLPVIKIVPYDDLWEFVLTLDCQNECWQAGFNRIGTEPQFDPYPVVEIEFPEEIDPTRLRIIPEIGV